MNTVCFATQENGGIIEGVSSGHLGNNKMLEKVLLGEFSGGCVEAVLRVLQAKVRELVSGVKCGCNVGALFERTAADLAGGLF